MRYYKVKLQHKQSQSQACIAVRAESLGHALVKADDRYDESLYELCCNPVREISEKEYRAYLEQKR